MFRRCRVHAHCKRRRGTPLARRIARPSNPARKCTCLEGCKIRDHCNMHEPNSLVLQNQACKRTHCSRNRHARCNRWGTSSGTRSQNNQLNTSMYRPAHIALDCCSSRGNHYKARPSTVRPRPQTRCCPQWLDRTPNDLSSLMLLTSCAGIRHLQSQARKCTRLDCNVHFQSNHSGNVRAHMRRRKTPRRIRTALENTCRAGCN
mmetsp:Transcript_93140/g.267985  ORF Transcript_93140/g.267985 Transcript_93140/m.267985 type:complete len:204 (+) Transcript_93140:1366-1977(+)